MAEVFCMIKEPNWLAEIRNKAQEEFLRLPFPQEREEEWRYSNIGKIKIDFKSGDSEVMIDGDDEGIVFTDMISATRTHTDMVKKHLGKALKINDKFSAFHFSHLFLFLIIKQPDCRQK